MAHNPRSFEGHDWVFTDPETDEFGPNAFWHCRRCFIRDTEVK